MHSPHPAIPPDAEGLPTSGPHDLNEYIMLTCSVLEQTKSMMERYYSLNTILRHERAGERVQPMRDRLARMVEENKKEEEPGDMWDAHSAHHSEGSNATIGSSQTNRSVLSYLSGPAPVQPSVQITPE